MCDHGLMTLILKHDQIQSRSEADPGFPVGGRGPILGGGGVDLQHRHFSVKMYVKTKELGGGVHRKICM